MTLALFFTFGVSMRMWDEDGIMDRELALYKRLSETVDHIYLFTYGDERDTDYADQLPDNVTVVPKKSVSNSLLYSFLCPVIHRDIFRDIDIVKTNQMLGSWTAIIASVLFSIPLVVRTGYILTKFYNKLEKPLPIRLVARVLETVSYAAADGIITSSPHGYDYIESRYWTRGSHQMVPNYIETDVFAPMDGVEPEPDTLLFVGRLAEQKNLHALLRALDDLPYSLTLVGEGPLEDNLRSLATSLNVDAKFIGRVPNHEIPRIINKHEAFILPSHFEGMPKSILEAMSCGVPCIGTDVDGTRDVVDDGETGVLCETDSESLGEAIHRLMSETELRTRLGSNARAEILENYSLDGVTQAEQALYKRLLKR
ncbi:glycosyltransferase family 4 protein [Halorubrum sp. GN11_10-6_MGM]|uniref:glycosyltransferase family 4 protein n=1 Tax=Halorubrum sp. GN11_10-6_MGM TaxID=2518112 RepID=UPI00130EF427|nr:glycosyltransferase family 4 protein [Halorubrum sp. GN11_10-6_MGM]